MLRLSPQVLALAVLRFWTGGFTFYCAVVVTVGQHDLSSQRNQRLVSRRVSNFLNHAGAGGPPVFARDAGITRDPSRRRRRRARWSALAGSVRLLAEDVRADATASAKVLASPKRSRREDPGD